MQNDTIENKGGKKSRARVLIKIMLLLVDDYRPADKMSMTEALVIVKNRLIKIALKETGGNTTAAADVLGMNRTTLMEHFRRQGGPDGRLFKRRQNRKPKQPTDSTEPTGRDEEE